jgi:hypothetical protein
MTTRTRRFAGAEAWSHNEMPEQPLEAGDTAFAYENGTKIYRTSARLVPRYRKESSQGDRNFVELARSRIAGRFLRFGISFN